MNILLIGSNSFIAQAFSKYHNQFRLKGISRTNFVTGFPNYIEKDFFNIDPQIFNGIDIVINFSSIVHQSDIVDEALYDKINNKLAVTLANIAYRMNVKQFIQMSTLAVYGNVCKIDLNTPCIPDGPYGRSKLRADEDLLKLQNDKFTVSIIRIPLVYGGGNAPGNMMRLIKLADKGIPLPFKKINNRRDFINVNNLVQYISLIAEKQLRGVFLISDREPVSTTYLFHTIERFLMKKVPLFHLPALGSRLFGMVKPKEYHKLFGSLEIQTNFPYENLINRHSVESGICEMVEWYKKIKSGQRILSNI